MAQPVDEAWIDAQPIVPWRNLDLQPADLRFCCQYGIVADELKRFTKPFTHVEGIAPSTEWNRTFTIGAVFTPDIKAVRMTPLDAELATDSGVKVVIARCVPPDKQLAVLQAAWDRMPAPYDWTQIVSDWWDIIQQRLSEAEINVILCRGLHTAMYEAITRGYVCSGLWADALRDGAGIVVPSELTVPTPEEVWLTPAVEVVARIQ